MKKTILLISLVCAGIAFSANSAMAVWKTEAVEAPKFFDDFYNRAIAVDGDGHPHIAYGGDNLYYTYFDGSIWHYEVADASPGVGISASIALDSNGKAHISYYDGSNSDLKYATNKSGVWVMETVDSFFWVGLYTSLALDSDGKAHISYYDSYNSDLKYATNTSGSWVKETVDSTGSVGTYTSLALDTDGKAHISYYDATNFDLKYATNTSGSWVKITVDSTGDVGQFPSIALDMNGKAHISYYDTTNMDLKYATNASGSWVTVTVDSPGQVGFCNSLALDTNRKVHISYALTSGLKYATNKSGSWVAEIVDSALGVGHYTSIALDSNGKAHISYRDRFNNDLKYATNASGSWVAETVDSSSDMGLYTSIALDTDGKAYISYVDYDPMNDLKYATNASGSWVTETVDNSGSVQGHTSIALDTNGKAHISYSGGSSDLKYATNASGSWVNETVDSTGYVGDYCSLALDTNGKAHISYWDYTNTDLKYATNKSGSWVAEIVDSTGYVGSYTSLALDTNGKAHISYYDGTNQDLKYATNKSGSWVTETVDSTGTVGFFTSIALDTNEKVHISYYIGGAADLKYATNKSGSWANEVVDTYGVSYTTSLALDTNGKAHISYYDDVNRDLKYATNRRGFWTRETVDSTGNVGQYSSIALDSGNNPHVSYFDGSMRDLKYAEKLSFAFDVDNDGIPDDPAQLLLCVGQTVTVDIWLTSWNQANISQIDYYFTWDPYYLEVQNVTCNNLTPTGQWQSASAVPNGPGSYQLSVVAPPGGAAGPNYKLHSITFECVNAPLDSPISAALEPDGEIVDSNAVHYGIDEILEGVVPVNTICSGEPLTCEEEDHCDVLTGDNICPESAGVTVNEYLWEPQGTTLYEGDIIRIFHNKRGAYTDTQAFNPTLCENDCFEVCYDNCGYVTIQDCYLRGIKGCVNGVKPNWASEEVCHEYQKRVDCNVICWFQCESSYNPATQYATYQRQCGFPLDETIYVRDTNTSHCLAGTIRGQYQLQGSGTAGINIPLPLTPGTYDLCAMTGLLGTVTVASSGSSKCTIQVPGNRFEVEQGVNETLSATLAANGSGGGTYTLSLHRYEDDEHTIELDLPSSVSVPGSKAVSNGGSTGFTVSSSNPQPGGGVRLSWANVVVRAVGEATCEGAFDFEIANGDGDGDGVLLEDDNCRTTYNPLQEDSYPPGGNNSGDACECEGNFDGNSTCDGLDAATFKTDFGRSSIRRPCATIDPCHGDFSCNHNVDGLDAALFKSDFGRSGINRPCPNHVTDPWCDY